jgi:hypothetical protein
MLPLDESLILVTSGQICYRNVVRYTLQIKTTCCRSINREHGQESWSDTSRRLQALDMVDGNCKYPLARTSCALNCDLNLACASLL